MKWLFWISLLAIAYTYFGYLAALLCISREKFKWEKDGGAKLSVTILVPAYNEENVIRTKLENLLIQDYPPEKVAIKILSDGSTDGTDDIVRSFSDPRIVLESFQERQGKTTRINKAVATASSELIVISDADVILEPTSLGKLLEPFNDSSVGVATGHRINISERAASKGMGARLYWKYETLLKSLESRAGRVMGMDGVFYAFRRRLYKPFNPRHQDDLLMALIALNAGMKALWVAEAICYERPATSLMDELLRRSRTVARSLHSFLYVGFDLIHPLELPYEFFGFFSHKVMRWLTPFFLIIVLGTSFELRAYPLYRSFFLAQCLFYLLATVGASYHGSRFKGVFHVLAFFLVSNLGILLGWFNFIVRGADATWTPATTMRGPGGKKTDNDCRKDRQGGTTSALLALIVLMAALGFQVPGVTGADPVRVVVPHVGAVFTSFKDSENMTELLIRKLNGKNGMSFHRLEKKFSVEANNIVPLIKLWGERAEMVYRAGLTRCGAALEGNILGDDSGWVLGLRVVNFNSRKVTTIRPIRLEQLIIMDPEVLAVQILRAISGMEPVPAKMKITLSGAGTGAASSAPTDVTGYLNGFRVENISEDISGMTGRNHLLVYRKGCRLAQKWVDIKEGKNEISLLNELQPLMAPQWGKSDFMKNEKLRYKLEWNKIALGVLEISNSCPDNSNECKSNYSYEVDSNLSIFGYYSQKVTSTLQARDLSVKSQSFRGQKGKKIYSEEVIFDHNRYIALYGSSEQYLKPFAFDPLSGINYIRSLSLKPGEKFTVWIHQARENYPLTVSVQPGAGETMIWRFKSERQGFMWPFVREFEAVVKERYPHVPVSFKYPSYFGAPITGTLIKGDQ